MLAYLAAYKGIWGPHLIIVPTSCLVNWEMEIKKFCPAFKVLTYYGSAKHRKELRTGWTKLNTFHICVTSYQLAVQDSFAFRRKKWYYLILDEAQNIKNFQSQRWQTLVNFNTQRRLLLTGTPLQVRMCSRQAAQLFSRGSFPSHSRTACSEPTFRQTTRHPRALPQSRIGPTPNIYSCSLRAPLTLLRSPEQPHGALVAAALPHAARVQVPQGVLVLVQQPHELHR